MISSIGDKVLLTADLHLSERNYYGVVGKSGLPIRLEDKLRILTEMVEYAKRENIDTFVIAGDIFHEPEVSEKLKSLFYSCFQSYFGKVIVVIGNHDIANDGRYNFVSDSVLSSQGALGKFYIIDKPETLGWIDFVPWLPADKMIQYFESTEPNSEYLVSHFLPSGARGHSSKLIGVPTVVFRKYRYAFGGDVHKAQVVDGSVICIGSPYRNDFGEETYTPGFIVYEKGKAFGADAFRPTIDRRFYTLRVTASNWQSESERLVSEGDFVKLVISGKKAELSTVCKPDVIGFVKSKGALYCAVSWDYEAIDMTESAFDISQEIDIPTLFEQYAKERNANDSLIAIGKEMLSASH